MTTQETTQELFSKLGKDDRSSSFDIINLSYLLYINEESIEAFSRLLKENMEVILNSKDQTIKLFCLTYNGEAGQKVLRDFLLNSFKSWQDISMTQKEYFFINILKEVPKIEIEQIEAFKPLIKYIVDYSTQLVDEIFYKKSLLDKDLIKLYKNLTALTGYDFMGYKLPLITEDIPGIHPDINKFLKFSYTDLSIQEDRNLLTKKLVSGLEKAMTNPLIASILGVSAGLVSICFYEDTLENGEISGDYFSDNPNIRIGNFSKFLRSEGPEVFKANIAYIIHELTHYVNDVVFQYSSKPFSTYDIQSWEVFNQITDEIWNIYDQNPDYISILGSYDSEQYTIEIPALYMEALTLETLSSRNIDRVLIEHIKLKNYMEGPLMSACNKFISWKNLLQDAYGKAENFLDRGMEIEICKIQELKLK